MSDARRVQELRRSNAAQPIPSGKLYRRKAKHRKAQCEADGHRGRNDEAPPVQVDRGGLRH